MFRNQIHLQLMLAILLTVIIRLMLYIDLIFTEQLGSLQASDVAYTINTTVRLLQLVLWVNKLSGRISLDCARMQSNLALEFARV